MGNYFVFILIVISIAVSKFTSVYILRALAQSQFTLDYENSNNYAIHATHGHLLRVRLLLSIARVQSEVLSNKLINENTL